MTTSSPDTPFDDELKVGAYVLLYGPHTTSASVTPRLFAQWYRVVSIDFSASATQPLVGLRGPDWPWTLDPSLTAAQAASPNLLTNELRCAIFPDVVAVHTRTIRLDGGTAWSSN